MMEANYISMNGRTYRVFFNNGYDANMREVVAIVRTSNGVDRNVTNAATVAKAAAIAIEYMHAEALVMDRELSAPLEVAAEKAASILEDVLRRRDQFGLSAQRIGFETFEDGEKFGVHFQTEGGDDIGGYAIFRDRTQMELVEAELHRLLSGAEKKAINADRTMVVTTYGGLILRARSSDVIPYADGSMAASWDMRHNLIHNPRYTSLIRANDIKEVRYE